MLLCSVYELVWVNYVAGQKGCGGYITSVIKAKICEKCKNKVPVLIDGLCYICFEKHQSKLHDYDSAVTKDILVTGRKI